MKTAAALLGFFVLAGSACERSSSDQPLPTVDAEGTLTIPEGYRPGRETDLSRVDCPQFLAMTPKEMRTEMRKLCESSTTAEERGKNPMCEGHRITEHCERAQEAGTP